MKNEKWISAYNWDGFYEASNLGRVRSIKRIVRNGFGLREVGGNIICPIIHKRNGYLVINLTGGGLRKQELLHRLILQSFIGPCPAGKEACHSDGDRLNSRLSNLRWDTRKNNHADKKAHGTWQGGEKNSISKLTEASVKEIRASRKPLKVLAELYNVSLGCIAKVKYRASWKHI